MNKITILMATYNGEKYINDQIDSILNQTYTNWQLIIRDDKSSDNTRQLLASYQVEYPDQIIIIEDFGRNLGCAQNFNILLQLAKEKEEEYIMFCDQDDFWLPDKIECTLLEMVKLEEKYGKSQPLLVHTDFYYVDAGLKIIASKKDYHVTKLSFLNLSNLLVQNPVYGCTTMINRSLVNIVNVIPTVAENHDYWVAMVASAFGKVAYSNKRTILYRQHGNNLSGSFEDSNFVNRFKRTFIQKNIFKDLANKIDMARMFKNTYTQYLNKEQINMIDNFINFLEDKSFLLFYRNVRNGVRKQSIGQTLLLYISVIFFKRQ